MILGAGRNKGMRWAEDERRAFVQRIAQRIENAPKRLGTDRQFGKSLQADDTISLADVRSAGQQHRAQAIGSQVEGDPKCTRIKGQQFFVTHVIHSRDHRHAIAHAANNSARLQTVLQSHGRGGRSQVLLNGCKWSGIVDALQRIVIVRSATHFLDQ